jgi:hypothetical protein
MEKNTVTLADRLRAAVVLTAELAELEKAGVAVYAGTYTASAQVPRYDFEEGQMNVGGAQKHQPVTVCRVFVERLGLERIIVKVNDEWEGNRQPPRPFLFSPPNLGLTMKLPSKGRSDDRVRVRIPWLLELEGEGLVAVIGSLVYMTH